MKPTEPIEVGDIIPTKPQCATIERVNIGERQANVQHAFLDSKTPDTITQESSDLAIMDWFKCYKMVMPKEVKIEARVDARVMLATLSR